MYISGTNESDINVWHNGKTVTEFFWCDNEPSSEDQPVLLDTVNMCYKTSSGNADGYICEKESGTPIWRNALDIVNEKFPLLALFIFSCRDLLQNALDQLLTMLRFGGIITTLC